MKTKQMTMCALFVGITAILTQISIPLGNIPLTMQIFGVVLSGLILGEKLGFISQFIYVLLGAVGMPIFSYMRGGFSMILGPSGGFILSFPILSFISGYFFRKYKNKYIIFFGIILGLIINYLIGTLFFCKIVGVNFISGLLSCVVPFVVFDLLKIILAYIIAKRINFKSI
jgi:biotin transport system substrate-specific component